MNVQYEHTLKHNGNEKRKTKILKLLMTAEYISISWYSELVEIRRNRFECKFIDCCNLLYYFGINKIM